MKSFLESIRMFFYFTFIYILYKVKWIEQPTGEKGYFVVKRAWVWLLFFPVLALIACVRAIIYAFLDIFDYDICYTQGEKRKLSFAEKLVMWQRSWSINLTSNFTTTLCL